MSVDSPITRVQQWLKTLLEKSGISDDVEIQVNLDKNHESPEQDGYWLTIDKTNLTPEQVQALIGNDGSVLDAIQYLANSILNLNQPPEQQASYVIELDGYRVKRQGEIMAIAESAAEQVRTTGQEVTIKSLSSAERRQIHSLFQDFADLETFSRGKEPQRHLVVRLTSSESRDAEI
jgi:spoIIIJ-associated protein